MLHIAPHLGQIQTKPLWRYTGGVPAARNATQPVCQEQEETQRGREVSKKRKRTSVRARKWTNLSLSPVNGRCTMWMRRTQRAGGKQTSLGTES